MPPDSTDHLGPQREYFEGKPSLLERLIKHPSFPRTMRKKIRFVAQTLGGCRRVLEVGTGHGLELGLLLGELGPDAEYVGVDLVTAPLRNAHRASAGTRRATTFTAALVERLPFKAGTFDGVFCVDVLHHAESQVAMLTELRRVLRPGGQLVCVEPNPLFPTNVVYLRNPVENGLFKFTRKNARTWTAAAGLVEPRITNLPVFFPSFPTRIAGLYELAERFLGRVPGIRALSTTRVLLARSPESGR